MWGAHSASDSSYSFELTASNQGSCAVDQVMGIELQVLPERGSHFTICLHVICQPKEGIPYPGSLCPFNCSNLMCCSSSEASCFLRR